MRTKHTTLIVAAGEPEYTDDQGVKRNKFKFKIKGKTLIEHAVGLYSSGNTIVALREENAGQFFFPPETTEVYLKPTEGALISAVLALRDAELEQPLVLVPGDSIVGHDAYNNFLSFCATNGSDISLIAFRSQDNRYSYVRTTKGKLIEVCEKKVISSLATTGIFYFSSAQLFINCSEWSIINNVRTNGIFYIAPSLNYAVIKGLASEILEIPEENYYRFSTFEEAQMSRWRYQSECE